MLGHCLVVVAAITVVVVVVVAFIYSRLLNRHIKSLLQEYLLGRGRGRGRGSNVMWRKRREEEVYKHFKSQYGESLLTLTQRIAKG